MGTLLVLLVGGLLGLLLIAGCLVVGSLGAVWFYAYVICRGLNRQLEDCSLCVAALPPHDAMGPDHLGLCQAL
jgi:hypothetical protein